MKEARTYQIIMSIFDRIQFGLFRAQQLCALSFESSRGISTVVNTIATSVPTDVARALPKCGSLRPTVYDFRALMVLSLRLLAINRHRRRLLMTHTGVRV